MADLKGKQTDVQMAALTAVLTADMLVVYSVGVMDQSWVVMMAC